MKVLISGYYGFGNAGDEAILYAMIEVLKACDPNIDITVLSDKPEQTRRIFNVNAVNRWRIFEICKALKEADGLLSGGGSLLQDKTSWRTIPYYTSIMLLARILKKPFVVFAQGLGPIHRGFNYWLVKAILSKASLISMRDEDSRALLQRMGVKQDIDLVPDPVLGLGGQWRIQKNKETPTVMVSIRSWPEYSGFHDKVSAALDRCVRKGFRVIFLPMHGKEDRDTAENVKRRMSGNADVVDYTMSFIDKLSMVGQADVLIGNRLHALIFAAVSCVPFVALSYDPKVDAFAKQCQQPLLGFEEWGEEDLYDLIMSQADCRQSESDKLEALISAQNGTLFSAAKKSLSALQK
ncbi:MAG TPA: polysaccharide pyruvyl transferase CsaB [Bacillales bacterium]|nr:polysaccharide pyruvyl transferase CsaB [Bacillales bacterium]